MNPLFPNILKGLFIPSAIAIPIVAPQMATSLIVSTIIFGTLIIVLEILTFFENKDQAIADTYIADIRKNEGAIDEIDLNIKTIMNQLQSHEDQLQATRAATGFKQIVR